MEGNAVNAVVSVTWTEGVEEREREILASQVATYTSLLLESGCDIQNICINGLELDDYLNQVRALPCCADCAVIEPMQPCEACDNDNQIRR
jgi:hypothetical protein